MASIAGGTGRVFLGPRQIGVAEALDLARGRRVLVFGTREVKLGRPHESRRLGTLEEDEVFVLADRNSGDEIQLPPECVELALCGLVQNELGKRAVIAKVALHQVEPGRQRPPCSRRVGVEIRTAILDEERVGKDAAEDLEIARGLVSRITHVHAPRAGGFSRAPSGWLPGEIPLTRSGSTRGSKPLRARMTRSRIASQCRRASCSLAVSAGIFRHRAWSSPRGPLAGHDSVRVEWIVARYFALKPGLAGDVAQTDALACRGQRGARIATAARK